MKNQGSVKKNGCFFFYLGKHYYFSFRVKNLRLLESDGMVDKRITHSTIKSRSRDCEIESAKEIIVIGLHSHNRAWRKLRDKRQTLTSVIITFFQMLNAVFSLCVKIQNNQNNRYLSNLIDVYNIVWVHSSDIYL